MSSLFVVAAIFCASPFFVADAQYQGQRSDCINPNGVAGICIGIRQCSPLLNLLTSQPLLPQTVDFLTQSQCGFEGKDPRVCCPFGPTMIPIERKDGTLNPPAGPYTDTNSGGSERINVEPVNSLDELLSSPLLPGECGKDLVPRIIGGKRTALDEFPWMALLEYQKPNGRSTACGGVLLNKRYVLTAAHCLKGKDLPPTWSLTSVRLGEYDTDTEQDCIEEEGDRICADDPITVGIEEQIVHEEYKPLSRDQKYDIALLRLSRDVKSTNYIKPICLPRSTNFEEKLYVAGWGKTENRSASNIKLKLSLPLSDRDQCERTYGQVGVRLGFGQLCAGGQQGKDSCRGDSGGPLMSVEKNPQGPGIWAVVGVVSFGPTPCGMVGWPGIYTRVVDFVPWIIGKMRP